MGQPVDRRAVRREIPTHLPGGYQRQCRDWSEVAVGKRAANSVPERAVRFLEEAIELAQSCGVHGDVAIQLVRDVYDRSTGNAAQEVGGVMLTLGALSEAADIDLIDEAVRELDRVRDPAVIAKVRARQAEKRHQFK